MAVWHPTRRERLKHQLRIQQSILAVQEREAESTRQAIAVTEMDLEDLERGTESTHTQRAELLV